MTAGATAAVVHVALLLLIGLYVRGLSAAALRSPASLPIPAWLAALGGMPLDLSNAELSPEIDVVSEADVLPEAWHSRPGDETIRQVETSPRVAQGNDPRPPAPDSGEGVGQGRPDAWRADQQTLKASLTDAAAQYRIARTRQGQRVQSPQAERREPRVGTGDAPNTAKRALALAEQPALPGEGERVVVPQEQVALMEKGGAEAQSGQGPLEAREGARRFDAQTPGAASDVVDQRSASDERHPAVIDLAAAGAQGPTGAQTQRGPSSAPGAVATPTAGVAPSLYGAPVPASPGPNVALNAREAQRLRYEREIKRRAQAMLRFPRNLAFALAQGETIVRFAVAGDGSLSGPVFVTKSAGYAEFDEEAVAAVKRAAPFPRMPETIFVNMRVAFENPVLR